MEFGLRYRKFAVEFERKLVGCSGGDPEGEKALCILADGCG